MGRFSLIGGVRRFRGRFLLVVLTLWSLAMVVPDFYRLVHPLGSFGLLVDGDGLVTDVRGPFSEETDSPAWRAGMRPGDRLDLARMRCIPVDTLRCATALAVLGKAPLASVGRHAELALAASAEKPAREVELVATTRPFSWWVAAVLPFDQIAAILVILAAAWLVWTRPGPMTWGFFLYIIWFNPGPVVPILCAAATPARPAAGAEYRRGPCRGRRFRRLPFVRPARAAGPDHAALASARARLAGGRGLARAAAGALQHQCVRLSRGDADARGHVQRLRGRRRRPRAAAGAARRAGAAGLPAPALGDLGLPDRLALAHHRRSRPADDIPRPDLGKRARSRRSSGISSA